MSSNNKNTKGKKLLNEKYCTEKYSSYNQITKEYDVFIISNEEYDKLSKQDKKEVKFVIAKRKAKVLPPDPKGPPSWALAIRDELVAMFNLKIDEVKQEVADVKQYVDKIVKVNKLKTK